MFLVFDLPRPLSLSDRRGEGEDDLELLDDDEEDDEELLLEDVLDARFLGGADGGCGGGGELCAISIWLFTTFVGSATTTGAGFSAGFAFVRRDLEELGTAVYSARTLFLSEKETGGRVSLPC